MGGHAVKSPAELVEAAAVVVTCVPSIEALEEVVGGAQGIAAAMRPGLVVVDVGTFSVARKERIRERLRSVGAEMLDAPVSGTPEMVAARKATAFVSGRPELYELVEPMFRALGEATPYVGDFGTGSKVKYIAQLMVAILGERRVRARPQRVGRQFDAGTSRRRSGRPRARLFQICSTGPASGAGERPAASAI